MTRPRLLHALAAIALTAALASCGDGGVSKSDFVTKADGACGTGNGSLAIAAKPTNLPELAAAGAAVASSVDGQTEALRKLEAPKDDKVVVAAVISALADVSGPARALQEAAGKSDDATTARAANDLKGRTDNAAAQAKAYGLSVCGQGLQAPVTTVIEGGRTVLKAAFVARAEALCTAANRKVDALAPPTSMASFSRYLTNYLTIEEKLFADIKALAVPPGDDTTVAEMLAAQDKVIAIGRDAQAAAQRGNEAQFRRILTEGDTVGTAANAKFDAYGLRVCGTLSQF